MKHTPKGWEDEFDKNFSHETGDEYNDGCECAYYDGYKHPEKCTCQHKEIKAFITSLLSKEREMAIEEIADNVVIYFIEWRDEVEKTYKSKKSAVLLPFPIWLSEKLQSLKKGEHEK